MIINWFSVFENVRVPPKRRAVPSNSSDSDSSDVDSEYRVFVCGSNILYVINLNFFSTNYASQKGKHSSSCQNGNLQYGGITGRINWSVYEPEKERQGSGQKMGSV